MRPHLLRWQCLLRTAIVGTIAATSGAVASPSQTDKRESAILARWGFSGATAERFQTFEESYGLLNEQLWLGHG